MARVFPCRARIRSASWSCSDIGSSSCSLQEPDATRILELGREPAAGRKFRANISLNPAKGS